MDPDLHTPDRATALRQRLQIAGAVLGVVVIWTLALWPSSPESTEPQSGPRTRSSPTPWTTGPFVGTTPSSSSGHPSDSLATSVPTVTGGTTSSAPRAVLPGNPVRTAPAAPSTTTPAATSTWTPPGQAKKPTRPPKALELLDLRVL